MEDCDHEIHLFPYGEDASKHEFSADCPCNPTVADGFESEDDEEEDDLKEVTIFSHTRMH